MVHPQYTHVYLPTCIIGGCPIKDDSSWLVWGIPINAYNLKRTCKNVLQKILLASLRTPLMSWHQVCHHLSWSFRQDWGQGLGFSDERASFSIRDVLSDNSCGVGHCVFFRDGSIKARTRVAFEILVFQSLYAHLKDRKSSKSNPQKPGVEGRSTTFSWVHFGPLTQR